MASLTYLTSNPLLLHLRVITFHSQQLKPVPLSSRGHRDQLLRLQFQDEVSLHSHTQLSWIGIPICFPSWSPPPLYPIYFTNFPMSPMIYSNFQLIIQLRLQGPPLATEPEEQRLSEIPRWSETVTLQRHSHPKLKRETQKTNFNITGLLLNAHSNQPPVSPGHYVISWCWKKKQRCLKVCFRWKLKG